MPQRIKFKINHSLLTVSTIDGLMKDAALLHNQAKQRGDNVMREVYADVYDSLSDVYQKLLTKGK